MFTNDLESGEEHTLSKLADDNQVRGVVNIPEDCGDHLKVLGEAGEMGNKEPHEVQQGELQSPALSRKQSQVAEHYRGHPAWK